MAEMAETIQPRQLLETRIFNFTKGKQIAERSIAGSEKRITWGNLSAGTILRIHRPASDGKKETYDWVIVGEPNKQGRTDVYKIFTKHSTMEDPATKEQISIAHLAHQEELRLAGGEFSLSKWSVNREASFGAEDFYSSLYGGPTAAALVTRIPDRVDIMKYAPPG